MTLRFAKHDEVFITGKVSNTPPHRNMHHGYVVELTEKVIVVLTEYDTRLSLPIKFFDENGHHTTSNLNLLVNNQKNARAWRRDQKVCAIKNEMKRIETLLDNFCVDGRSMTGIYKQLRGIVTRYKPPTEIV